MNIVVDKNIPFVLKAFAPFGEVTALPTKAITRDAVRAADVVITMVCGDACPIFPGKRYEEWVLDDPAGHDVATVRPIRDEIERRVRALLDELHVAAGG